ncbi:hypothetical protein MesoLjLc_42460 [Mesorhizobium sp. L-8-10]|nr:hypothetical protein MesoLjLc_42460 [Mesorhizobium sp. L-8-10]
MIIPFAAFARLDVELERHCSERCGTRRFHRLVRNERPPKIGVQYCPGQVEDGAQRRALYSFEAGERVGGKIARLRRRCPDATGGAGLVKRFADGVRRGLRPEALDSRRGKRCLQHTID